MSTNISKFIQLNDFLLLEYEFNKDGVETDLTDGGITPVIADTTQGFRQYYNIGGVGATNNNLSLQSTPLNSSRSGWYINPDDEGLYQQFFDSSISIAQDKYPHDTVKVHVVSGYNFDDVTGFLLQLRAKDTSGNLLDISNFSWIKQVNGDDVQKFATNTLFLTNRFYDKYIELKIPSIQELGGDTLSAIGSELGIQALSDVYITYSTILVTDNFQYDLDDTIKVQLPVISNADNFNCFIASSTSGDYIEFYAMWNGLIIGENMSDIESGRIKLYTSNNPNDNFEEFTERYGTGAAKWSVMHELYVYEHIAGGTSLLTQKYVFTQDTTWSDPNYFRPVIINADIASSYSIDYICRLTNRMDGSQIIRKATYASTDPKKYGRYFQRLNVENVIPYNIFNRIEGEVSQTFEDINNDKPKFVKVFFDTTTVVVDENNTVYPQGTGPLFLKRGDSTYKFKFDRLNTKTDPVQRENVDLSGVFNYSILFVTDDDVQIEIEPTYSTNMNTVLGELEFKLMDNQINTLLNQTNNSYQIRIKNPDGTSYTFYEGTYFDLTNQTEVLAQYNELFNVTSLQSTITELEASNAELIAENNALKST